MGASRKRLEARLAEKPRRRSFAPLAGLPWLSGNRRRWVYAGLVLLLLLQVGMNGAGLARASQAWLPGDFLYPLKTVYEEAGFLFTFSRAGDARLHIQSIQKRLLEMQALMFEGRYDEVPQVAADFEFHVTQAVILVEGMAKSDPEQARLLARDLKTTLVKQANLIELLALFVPEGTQVQCRRVASISVSGVFAVQDILGPNGMRSAPLAYSFVDSRLLP